MEVRIKDNNGYVDADWIIEDGIMVVSPKVEKFEPKDGDVVACEDYDCLELFIFKERIDEIECACHCYYCEKDNCLCVDNDEYVVSRFATEEEKQKLFDKLAEEGWEWNADTKELVKLKWKPKEGEVFWLPLYYTAPVEFGPITSLLNKRRDKTVLDKGWCFKTKEECQEFCNRLNDAINKVKP